MIFIAAMFSLAQTSVKKGSPPAQMLDPSKPDTWEKMRECAAQAEKVRPGEAAENSGIYTNHYSPKYDRCYVRITWVIKKGEKVLGQRIRLLDAFEHDTMALSFVPSSKYNRRYVGITRIIKKGGEVLWQGMQLLDAFEYDTSFVPSPKASKVCLVLDHVVDCSEARDFISEHMGN